ncbi:MAG: DEAD/DEAH box helicase, partial [Clostridia bacterium]|nr:DEAD/DEAH box helicase [Clostridia bacterium]
MTLETIEKLKEYVINNCSETYKALKNNNYTIAYSKIAEENSTNFFAYLKSKSYVTELPKMLHIQFPCKEDEIFEKDIAPLALYLYVEKKLFTGINTNSNKGTNLSEYEKAKLLNLFNELPFNKIDAKVFKKQLSLDISITLTEKFISISYKVNKDGRLYRITNIGNFCNTFFKHEQYKLQKDDTINLTFDTFSEPYNKIIAASSMFFSHTDSLIFSFDKSDSTYPHFSEMGYLLHLLRDVPVTFAGGSSRYEILDGFTYLNENETIDVSPEIDKNMIYCYHANELYIFKDKKLYLYLFPSENSLLLYLFLFNNGIESFEYIKDKFLSDIFSLSPTDYLSMDVDKKYEICLYVDLLNKQSLHLETKYFLNGKEITVNEAKNDSLFRAMYSAYTNELYNLNVKERDSINEEDRFLNFINSDLSNIKKYASIYLSEDIKNLTITQNTGFARASFSKKEDYLALTIDSNIYSNDELLAIYNAYRQKKQYYILKNQFISFKNDEVEKFNKMMDLYKIRNSSLYADKIPFYDLYKFTKDLNNGVKLDEMCINAIKNVTEFEKCELPEAINRHKSLARTYQISAVKWLYTLSNNHLSGILADDMGLGKTFETLMYLDILDTNLPILIVTPKSLIYNWGEEIKKFTPNLHFKVIDGNKDIRIEIINNIEKNKKVIYISSYDSLRSDIETHENIEYGAVILDEGQYIKNALAKKSMAVRKLKSQHRFVLTGTPIENSLADLWSIFDFLMPNFLGSYKAFRDRFESTDKELLEANNEELAFKVKPFILRRVKEDVLKSLPPKTETIVKVTMEQDQRKIYLAYLNKAREKINENEKILNNPVNILSILTRLREICIDPSTFIEQYTNVSAKLSLAVDTIKEITSNNRKIVVFSSFVKVLDHLKKLLAENNIQTYFIHGQVDADKRIEICNNFNNNDDVKVVLV